MEKLNKIFLGIIIVLAIALIVMTYMYFKLRKIAKENLNAYINLSKQLQTLNSSN